MTVPWLIGLLAVEVVHPTPEVRAIHQKGEEALANAHYQEAARYFRAALALQPQNLAWLGLGEALVRQGACGEADEALAQVAAAPETPESPAQYAAPLAAGLRRGLEDRCPGRLLVRCETPLERYSLDGDEGRPCGEVVEVPAGSHQVRGVGGLAEITFQVRGLALIELTLAEPVQPEPAVATIRVTAPAPEPAHRTLGFSLLGAGVVGLGLGLSFQLGPLTSSRDEAEQTRAEFALGQATRRQVDARDDAFEGWRTATLATYLTAAVVGLAGGAILILDW